MSPLVNRLVFGFVSLAIVVVGGALGYWWIGDGRWTLFECLYMTVITISTVGYGEMLRGMEGVDYARAWTLLLLLFGTGAIVYFASTVTAFIVEGDLKNVLFASRLKKRMKGMKDHVIVCGAGSTGGHVIEELIRTGVPVVAVDRNEEELKELAERYGKSPFTYVVGDATDDDLIASLHIDTAKGLVAALANDKDNLYLTVAARHLSPTVRIVARCAEISHVEKLKRVGADAVVSPNFIGGMRLVSEMVRPTAVKFLDEMLRDKRAAYRIEEVRLGDRATELGATLGGANIRKRFETGVLALRPQDGAPFTFNPGSDAKLEPGMTLVVLGTPAQVEALRKAIS